MDSFLLGTKGLLSEEILKRGGMDLFTRWFMLLSRKESGDKPITSRAHRIDINSESKYQIPPCDDATVRRQTSWLLESYGHISPSRLRAISHAPDAPWDRVVKAGGQRVIFGMRINNRVISEHFHRPKLAVSSHPKETDPDDDAPFA